MKTLHDQLTLFAQACRTENLRLTPQRMEIFKELAQATDHPSAETLHQRLVAKTPTLSLDTVYRTLTTFAHHGLIQKVVTVESQARYEVVISSHHHLICQNCKEISDFQWAALEEAGLPEDVKGWGKIERKNVTLYGVCRKCRS